MRSILVEPLKPNLLYVLLGNINKIYMKGSMAMLLEHQHSLGVVFPALHTFDPIQKSLDSTALKQQRGNSDLWNTRRSISNTL